MKNRVEIQKIFSVKDCNNNPNKIYIFGDNFCGVGKGGQAIIRDCHNVYGIPTKRTPSMDSNAFFSDNFDEYDTVKSKIEQLIILALCKTTTTFVFPEAGLGTGLARMNQTSPKLFKYMNRMLYKFFGVYHEYC